MLKDIVTAANNDVSGSTNPPSLHRALWKVILTLLTGVLIVARSVETLQEAVITEVLPFSVIIIIMIAGLLKSLSLENTAVRSGNEILSARELWIIEKDVDEETTIINELNPNIKKIEEPEYK